MNARRPRSPRPAQRVVAGRHAAARTTSSDSGTRAAKSRSSRPSYADGSSVTTVGVQPASARCGASKRTRCDAALESGGKCGLTISTRRILSARLHANAGAGFDTIALLDLLERCPRDGAVQKTARRGTAEAGFAKERDQPFAVVHPFVLMEIGE